MAEVGDTVEAREEVAAKEEGVGCEISRISNATRVNRWDTIRGIVQ